MNCKQAKSQLALWVGPDGEVIPPRELLEHVNACQCCQQHWKALRQSLDLLELLAEDPEVDGRQSVWPRVSKCIAARYACGHGERFNGWMPAIAVTAACLLIVVLTDPAPQNEISVRGADGLGDVRLQQVYNASGQQESNAVIDADGRLYGDPSWTHLGRDPRQVSRRSTPPRSVPVNSNLSEF